jgi:RNase P protein component
MRLVSGQAVVTIYRDRHRGKRRYRVAGQEQGERKVTSFGSLAVARAHAKELLQSAAAAERNCEKELDELLSNAFKSL